MVLHAAATVALLYLPMSPWSALPDSESDRGVRHSMLAPSAVVDVREPTPFDGATLRVVVGGVAHELDPLASGTLTIAPDGSTRLHGLLRVGTSDDRDDRDGSDRGGANVAWSMASWGIGTLFFSFTVVNVSPESLDFLNTITMPSFASGDYSGTVAGVLTDLNGDGATLTGPPDGFAFQAAIDGVYEFALLGPSYSMSAPPLSFALVGPTDFPIQPGPPMNESAGMRIDFVLTPFDQVTFHGSFTFWPGPISP